MKKILLTILFLLITCNAWAATTFNDTTADHKWSTAANWSDGIPDSADAVTFNAAVTALIIDIDAVCASFDTSATTTITISGSGSFTDLGNLTLSDGVTWTHTGAMVLAPPTGTTAVIVTPSIVSKETPVKFPTSSLTFSGEGTVYLGATGLRGNLSTAGDVTHTRGTINLRSFAIKGLSFTSNSGETRAITDDSGSSVGSIICTGTSGTLFNISATGLTVSGTPNLKIGDVGRYPEKTLTGDITIAGAGKSWGDLLLRRHKGNYAYIISDSNSWRYATIETPNSDFPYNKVKIASGTTQTFLSLTAHGDPSYPIRIESTTSGSAATISDTTGMNTFLHTVIKDITATGGAVFGAGGSTNTNVSGNTGFLWADSNKTYYVKAGSAGGSDAAAGTSDATAWETIAKVQSTVIPGDTVYFRGGDVWTGATPVLTTTAGVSYYGTGYGSGKAIIRTASYTTNTGTVHIATSSNLFDGFEVDVADIGTSGILIGGYANSNADVNDTTIDNCLIHDAGSLESWLGGGISSSPRNSADGIPHTNHRIIIQNTIVHDTGRSGVSMYPAWTDYNGNANDVALLRNIEVYNAGKNGDTPESGNGFHLKDDSRNITAEFCNLHDNTYYGILYEAYLADPLTAVTNSIFRNSLVYENGISGISIFKSASNTTANMSIYLYNNLFFNNGVAAYAGSTSSQIVFSATDLSNSIVNIYNNTFFQDSAVVDVTYPTSILFGTGEESANGITGTPVINFANNIVYQTTCTSNVRGMIVDVGQKVTHNNNLIYCGTGEAGYKVRSGSSWYKTNAEVQTWESTAQVTDPTFTGGTLPTCFSDATGVCGTGTYGVDLRPNTTYFSITSGDVLGNGAVLASDYNKAINNAGTDSTYTRGTAWDIGAYEYTLDGGATIVNTGAVFSGCTF